MNFLISIFALEGYRPVAQLAERRSPKPKVGGSMPSWPAKTRIVIENHQSSRISDGCKVHDVIIALSTVALWTDVASA